MESSTHRSQSDKRRQQEIRRQIKALQAQLSHIPDDDDEVPRSHERKQAGPALLAPSTPSPRKKRRIQPPDHRPKVSTTNGVTHSRESDGTTREGGRPSVRRDTAQEHHKAAPSNVLKNLASQAAVRSSAPVYNRSSSLSERPCPHQVMTTEHSVDIASQPGPRRDDTLAIVEELSMGPADHKPPPDDPHFDRLEPNSGIRLSSRLLSHVALQEYLRGRYYLSPSRLYSCVRLSANKSSYDVPVEGDWVTIAVVAERGQVRSCRAAVGITPGDDDGAPDDAAKSKPNTCATQSWPPKAGGKKYVNMKLIDFGAARLRPSATAGKAGPSGDTFLSLLLFESDGFDELTEEDGRTRKIYHGGSKGAFEAMSKLKEGDVIALLNPRVLKPYKRAGQNAQPTNNILAVTPESAGSIAMIGRAQDLGMCRVVKRDGKICGSWTDKRIGEVCEWHTTNAVQRQRAGRAEFFAGTSGAPKRKAAYDPGRQWGLKPQTTPDDSAYIVSGHVVSGSTSALFVGEKLGREAQAKAKRQLEKGADRNLQALLKRDKEGAKAVIKAREFVAQAERSGSGAKNDAKGKRKAMSVSSTEDTSPPESSSAAALKPAYSASIIKQLGFDPAAGAGKRPADLSLEHKIEALNAVQSSRGNIHLASRPGPKVRSAVSVPAWMQQTIDSTLDDGGVDSNEAMIDLDGDSET